MAIEENNSHITSCKGKDSGHPQVNLEDVKGTTNTDNKIIVDFKRKETEAGWIHIMDNFGLNATPIWFNWLSWVLLTGAFLYFFEKAQNIFQKIGLGTIIAISIGLLWFHFNAVFYRVEFRGIPFVKNLRRSRIASMILSGILAFGSWRFALALVQIVRHGTT